VKIQVPTLAAFKKAVESQQIPHDQFAHGEPPMSSYTKNRLQL
jgi:hypothetical protein